MSELKPLKLTMDDYQEMPLPSRLKVDEWLQKYDLTNVHTVVRSGDDDGIICYGYNIFPFYRSDKPMIFTSDADLEVVSALFDFDDFPWEVLNDA